MGNMLTLDLGDYGLDAFQRSHVLSIKQANVPMNLLPPNASVSSIGSSFISNIISIRFIMIHSLSDEFYFDNQKLLMQNSVTPIFAVIEPNISNNIATPSAAYYKDGDLAMVELLLPDGFVDIPPEILSRITYSVKSLPVPTKQISVQVFAVFNTLAGGAGDIGMGFETIIVTSPCPSSQVACKPNIYKFNTTCSLLSGAVAFVIIAQIIYVLLSKKKSVAPILKASASIRM